MEDNMPNLLRLLIVLALAGCGSAEVRDDPGGVVRAYEAKFERYQRRETRVVMSGTVASAATIYLGLKDACTHRDTQFKFHGASIRFLGLSAPAPKVTETLSDYYPPALKSWFYDSGASELRGADFKSLSGEDLIQMGVVKNCE
jgi:hypothetical protein